MFTEMFPEKSKYNGIPVLSICLELLQETQVKQFNPKDLEFLLLMAKPNMAEKYTKSKLLDKETNFCIFGIGVLIMVVTGSLVWTQVLIFFQYQLPIFFQHFFFSIEYLDLKPRGIESPDLEKVMYENGICPTQAQLVAPFRVRAFWYHSIILNSNFSGICTFVIG